MKTFFALTTGFLSGFIFCTVCVYVAIAESKEEEKKDEMSFRKTAEEIDEILKGIEA